MSDRRRSRSRGEQGENLTVVLQENVRDVAFSRFDVERGVALHHRRRRATLFLFRHVDPSTIRRQTFVERRSDFVSRSDRFVVALRIASRGYQRHRYVGRENLRLPSGSLSIFAVQSLNLVR